MATPITEPHGHSTGLELDLFTFVVERRMFVEHLELSKHETTCGTKTSTLKDQ